MPRPKSVRTKFEHADPILSVADMKRSLRYYVDALGFSNAEWGGDDFTCVTLDGANIYLSEGDQGHPGTWVWLGVDDVEALLGFFADWAPGLPNHVNLWLAIEAYSPRYHARLPTQAASCLVVSSSLCTCSR